MTAPLTSILLKIVAKGFYKEHSGLLLFLFATLLSYCFYIEVLNQTHLTPDQILLHNFAFVLNLISSPIMLILISIIWLVLTIKSWNYVLLQTSIQSNQFLFYSSTSLSKIHQLKSWFIVQLVISLPILAYGLFSLLIGFVFEYYLIPILLILYVLLLSLVSAFLYVKRVNSFVKVEKSIIFSKILFNWRKPFFTLYIFHVFERLKTTFIITKLFSYSMIAGGVYILAGTNNNLVVTGIIVLGVAITHSILIYHSYLFEHYYLRFSLNFPYSRIRVYFYWAINYLLLTLPENIWFLSNNNLIISILSLLLNLSIGMLFRNLLYWAGLNMKKYLYWIFFLFYLFFVIILLKMYWLLFSLNFIVSVLLLYKNYYRQR